MFRLFLKRSSPVFLMALFLASLPGTTPRARAADKEDQSIDMDEPNSRDDGSSPSRSSESGYLGVSIQLLRHNLRQAFDIPDDVDGLIISQVYDGSPADRAGLKDKDVIVRFNGQKVGNEEDFTRMIRRSRPGSEATLSVWRDGRVRELTATLGSADQDAQGWTVVRPYRDRNRNSDESDAPEPPAPPAPPDVPNAPRPGKLMLSTGGHMGVYLQDLNKEIAEFFSARDARGALVWQVIEGSPAAEAGLKAGDVITAVDGKDVGDSQDLREVLAGYEAGQTVSVKVLRRGESRVIPVKLDKGEQGGLAFDALRGLDLRGLDLRGVPGFDNQAFRGRQRKEDLSRIMDRLQREMDQLRERMNRMKEDLDRLKD